MADPTVRVALVVADIALSAADWGIASRSSVGAGAGSGQVVSPLVLLDRNFTVRGAYENQASWPTLDFSFQRAKARGIDLFVASNGSSSPAELALVLGYNMAIVSRVCLPSKLSQVAVSTNPRPPRIPGNNTQSRLPEQPDCAAGSSTNGGAALMRRCWVAVTVQDNAAYGHDVDAYGKAVPNGYIFWLYGSYNLCEVLMGEECVSQLGAVGCFYNMTAAYSPDGDRGREATGWPDAGRQPSRVGPLVGGIVGGIGALLVVVVTAAAVLKGRRAAVGARHEAGARQCEGGRVQEDKPTGLPARTSACAGTGKAKEHSQGTLGSPDGDGAAGAGAGAGGGCADRCAERPRVPAAVLAQCFEREVAVLARCQHPNVIRMLAANLGPPRACLVMELMETSLEGLLYGSPRAERLLPLPTVLHIAVQVARALSYMHPTILHRDLKPANVLVSQPDTEKPTVKVAVPYMAPEAFDCSNFTITDRADMYAFGVMLWEMLAGCRPWLSRTPVQVAYAVTIRRERPPLGQVPERRCPPALRALILSCWEDDPQRRPAAAEVVKMLVVIQESA
ncbi:hypothetical protein GPECTOR_23g105 [Gonium pectorale]|uniref:Protein kinase domain-containing protein n=1 Tax=Gonium pectorale TaxID=33097 RepID=A0A150GGR5_GONPE|nr:hypothetical protein GPECTOR_23g105 [Gonium pectorale]|eukprot:KXZ49016.1 hypothetical protein GPECTOR_23g105 [Gonium pectorale]